MKQEKLILSLAWTILSSAQAMNDSIATTSISLIDSATTDKSLTFVNDSVSTSGVKTMAETEIASTSTISVSRNMDFTKAVGEIPIQSDVTPLGGRTYTVPIGAPAGIGHTPQISLVYNSQQGGYIAGEGWNIAGLSTITRSNKSIYYDGATDGINIDNAAFVLDGQRLIRIEDEGESPCYQSVQGNIKVTATVSNYVITHFKVFYPDGRIGEYASMDEGLLYYPLVKLTDIDGNSIDYTYSCTDNTPLIESITYNTYAQIAFTYESRTDVKTSYVNGHKYVSSKRLKSISSKWNGSSLGDYTLSYTTANYRSMLTQIDYSRGNASLNPLKFSYGEKNMNNSFLDNNLTVNHPFNLINPTHNHNYRFLKGRLSLSLSDGILILPNRSPYMHFGSVGDYIGYIENEYDKDTDSESIVYAFDLDAKVPITGSISKGNGFVDILCSDLTGEQYEYIVKINNINENDADKLTFNIYSYTSYEMQLVNKYTYTIGSVFNDFTGNKSVRPKHFYAGDFNGDGKQEIMVIVEPVASYDENFGNTCYIFDLINNTILYKGTPFSYKPTIPETTRSKNTFERMSNTERLLVHDYNGDGKNDLCLINESGISVFEFKTSGTRITSCVQIKQSPILKQEDLKNRGLFVGEFNGDGLIDLLISPKHNNSDKNWGILYSTGNGDFALTKFSGVPYGTETYDGFDIQDINCDGRTDLIQYTKDAFTTYITINDIPSSTATCTTSISEYAAIIPTNIISHNYFSQVLTFSNKTLTKHSFQNDVAKQKLLTAATSSLGNIEYTIYKYPYEEGCSYSVETSEYAGFPYVRLYEKIPFVSSSCQDIEGSIQKQQYFTFRNLIMHRQGLGLCGMEYAVFNSEQDFKSQEYNPTKHGILLSEKSKTSETAYSYEIKYPNEDRRVQVNLTRKETSDNLSGFSSTVVYGYNEYGFPVTEETTTSDGFNSLTMSSVVHHNTSAGYMLNVLKEQTTTTTKDGSSHYEKVSFPSMYYNKPLQKYHYTNGLQVSYETFAYTNNGLLAKKTLQNYSSPYTLTTSYEYDNYGRLTKETTPESLTKEYRYNWDGSVYQYKDELGVYENYGYDDLGRRTLTARVGSPKETVQYIWQQGAPFNSYGYVVQKEYSNGCKEKTYFNPKRQVVCTSQNTAFDYDMVEYRTYDNYGNMLTQSVPVKSTSSQRLLTQYSYDEYNRLTSIQEPLGRITTYAYNKNQTTTVKEGIETIRTYDSQGNMTAVTDTTGTITYTYRPDGQLLSTTVPCGLTTTMEYDSYGRQTKLIDPCAGTTTFTYDTSGNMASKKDGAGKQTLMEYDQYGRMTLKNHVGTVSTTYTYDAKGLLIGESDSNGATRTYEYDDCGRLLFEHQRTDNAGTHNLNKFYAYSNVGDLYFVEYAYRVDGVDTTLGIEYYNRQNGHLKSITFEDFDFDTVYDIWNIQSCNDFGQPSMVASGPLTHAYEYDALQYLTRISTVKGNETLREMRYTFNPLTGNLSSREDVLRNLTEDFSYDNMNRLTGDNTETYSYDNQTGNMTYNSRLGNLTYGSRLQVGYHLSVIDPIFAEESGLSNKYLPKTQQTITYNALSRPATITEGNYHLDFTYNGNGERIHSYFYKKETPDVLTGTVTTDFEHRYYLGNYERHINENGSNRYILYLGGDAYSAPAAFILDDRYGRHMAYICRDYLGSITHVVSDHYSLEYSYDAWGNLRDPESYELIQPILPHSNELFLGRGYTGHEHHRDFGLINMNARLYNPYVGRFISPDPFVQMPDNSQNFNRFIYCLNNPLRYTDESGEFFGLITGFIFGGSFNLITNALNGNLDSFGDALASFAIGGVAGATGAAVSSSVGSAFACSGFAGGVVSGTFGGFTGGFVSGAGQAWYNGSSFWNGLVAGYGNGLSGAVTGAITQGLAGGIAAQKNGFNFWDGSRMLEVPSLNGYNLDPDIDYIANAKGYEDIASLHDDYLHERVSNVYQIQEGDFGITKITTSVPANYGMYKGAYVNMKGRYLVDGVTYNYFHGKTSVHISLSTLYQERLPLFKAVVGHELLHAFQYYTVPIKPIISHMEAQAYRYSYEVCFNAGYYKEAMKYSRIIIENNFWNINSYTKRPNTWGFR